MKKAILITLFIVSGCSQAEATKDLIVTCEPGKEKGSLSLLGVKAFDKQKLAKNSRLGGEIKVKSEEDSCFPYYFDGNREATKTEIAAMGAIPMYLFCSKLGWPFCCLCI